MGFHEESLGYNVIFSNGFFYLTRNAKVFHLQYYNIKVAYFHS